MTKCMIKRNFFREDEFELTDVNEQEEDENGQEKALISFALPFSELKQLTETVS